MKLRMRVYFAETDQPPEIRVQSANSVSVILKDPEICESCKQRECRLRAAAKQHGIFTCLFILFIQ